MAPPPETILFEAISTPPQSFSARGFRVLAGLLILAALVPASVFFALGAWPVLPFIGVEVGAALAALLWHARASRRISEMVLLTDAGLSIRHVDHRGRVVRSVLDAYWAKVELDEPTPRGGKLMLKAEAACWKSAGIFPHRKRLNWLRHCAPPSPAPAGRILIIRSSGSSNAAPVPPHPGAHGRVTPCSRNRPGVVSPRFDCRAPGPAPGDR